MLIHVLIFPFAASLQQPLTRRAVLFDADGTLLNSLPPHVDFVHTMNDELELGLSLPSRDDLAASRLIAAAPMANFFRRANFPESAIAACVEAYEGRFAAECKVAPFDGVEPLLSRLSDLRVPCAVVSSNTAHNVRRGLGDSARFLDFILGIDNAPADKAEAIAVALDRLELEPVDAIYVGDTRKDFDKASAAGVAFLGVDFGFEALHSDGLCAPVALSVGELGSLLAAELQLDLSSDTLGVGES